MNLEQLVYGLVALIFAGLISFVSTPIAKTLALKVGAVDIPKDNRRMHKVAMPLMGGVAIYLGFLITCLIFCDLSPALLSILGGGTLIAIVGMLDDMYGLNSILKFVLQIGISFVAISQGVVIESINLFGNHISFGVFSIPITVFWIVGLTNAINLIDGLDGLACGVSSISSLSLLLVAMVKSEPSGALLTAILAGACLGFLPFNSHPAKIFMGDTGALFLGYTLACISIQGVFKLHAVVSFMIPLSIFGLPLFDTLFAIVRRICSGRPPFAADRGHLHHKLVDMGFDQKQTVKILYAVCGILGISAVLLSEANLFKAIIVIITGFSAFFVNYLIIKSAKKKEKTDTSVSAGGDVEGDGSEFTK